MKKVLLAGYYGENNIGDEAIAEALIKELKRRGYEVLMLSGDRVTSSQLYGVEAYNRQRLQDMKTAIKSCDFVILGGGSLIQDVTSTYSLWYYTGFINLCRIMGKHIYIAYQGIGPITKKTNELITKITLNRSKKLWIRDEISIDTLREIGVVKPNITLSSDAVFMLNPPSRDQISVLLAKAGIRTEDGRPIIGISPRPWGTQDKAGVFAKIADECINRFNAKIVFYAFHKNEDVKYINDICSRMTNRAYIVADSYLPSEIMGMMGAMTLNIGVRLHSLIFSAKMGVPLLGVSYDPKIDGFLDMLGMSPVCTYSELSKEQIMPAVSWIMKNTFPVDNMLNAINDFEKLTIRSLDEILLESEMEG
jgi:polysaccharide pyruvyl transferase CsaB